MPATFIPPWIVPDEEDFELVDDTTSVFRPELAPGITQRQSFGPPRWKISRKHTVRQEELALLMACLVAAEGQYNTIYSKVNWLRRGSFPVTELVANNQFASGTTDWTSSNAELVISVTDRALRAARSGGINDVTIRATALTTVNGAYYGARAFVKEGRDAINAALRLGTAAGGSELTAGTFVSSQQLMESAAAATGTTTHFSIMDENAGKGNGSFSEYLYTSVTRTMRVDGGSQTGSALLVESLPTSTNGLLLPNDWVSVNGELKMVTSPLNSDSSGDGYLRFKPALFESPPDDTPVFVIDPIGKFLATNLRITNRYGSDAIIFYDLEEVVEP